MKIVFVCHTCISKNKHNSDRPAFTPWQVEYDTFSEAWQHLFNTSQDRDESTHFMVAEIRD